MKLGRLAKSLATGVNLKRRAKGLLPRPVSFSNLRIIMQLPLGHNCCQSYSIADCSMAFHVHSSGRWIAFC